MNALVKIENPNLQRTKPLTKEKAVDVELAERKLLQMINVHSLSPELNAEDEVDYLFSAVAVMFVHHDEVIGSSFAEPVAMRLCRFLVAVAVADAANIDDCHDSVWLNSQWLN
jgi:hypothetical protein